VQFQPASAGTRRELAGCAAGSRLLVLATLDFQGATVAHHPAAYAQWRHAEALLDGAAGAEVAAEPLRAAHAAAARLGAAPLRTQLEALARRARISLTAAGPAPAPAPARPHGLTDREADVLRLLAAGHTNREIGQQLFISPKTASVHVTSILLAAPPVLFLDEPTTGLDPRGRLELWQALGQLAAGGTSVLLTTQYIEEAERLATAIVIIGHGTVIVRGRRPVPDRERRTWS